MRLGPGLVALAFLMASAGCGGHDELPSKATAEGPIGQGASGVWLYRPAGKPKDLVVYFHGQGGAVEATPENHLPWIRHLVARGSIVVYPRYETVYEVDPMEYIVNGVRAATKRVDVDGLPVLAIGYSRGGALAVEYGAVAGEKEVPVPDSIMSVFPATFGNQQNEIDLGPLARFTQLLMLVGDKDTVVGAGGAATLGQRLQASGFPGENIQVAVVKSHGAFTADHFAPLSTSPGAKAAFWKPADAVLDVLDQGYVAG
jgi:predicted esterase